MICTLFRIVKPYLPFVLFVWAIPLVVFVFLTVVYGNAWLVGAVFYVGAIRTVDSGVSLYGAVKDITEALNYRLPSKD